MSLVETQEAKGLFRLSTINAAKEAQHNLTLFGSNVEPPRFLLLG